MIGRLIRVRRMRRRPGWLHRQAGDRARDARDWATAADEYAAYLRINPQDAPIWVQRGHMLKEGGDNAGAERAYRRAVDLNPREPDPIFQLAGIMVQQNRTDLAIEYFRRSAHLDPNGPAVAELGFLGASYDPLSDGARIDANIWISDLTLVRTLLDARAAYDLRQWSEAERLYLKYLEYRPSDKRARKELDAMRSVADLD